jgi:lipopolysaccharide export system protein LptC
LTVAPHFDDQQEPAVFAAAGRRNDARIFRAARRHSRRVRLLRLAIPICVVIVVAVGVAITSWFNPLRVLAKVPVDVSGIVVSGTKLTMQQPRIAGYTSDKRAYEMTAQAAAQDLMKTDVVELQGIRATMEMKDKVTLETTARVGFYNTKTEHLTLQNNVHVKTSSGYQARLAEAQVDIRNGKLISDKPVEVNSFDWTVNANRLEVSESGDVVKFDNGVSVVLQSGVELPRMDASAGSRKR